MDAIDFGVDEVSVKLITSGGDRVALRFAKDGDFEPESLAVWARSIRRGARAIDVGAYNGIYSLIAAKCGAFPIAIEPMPEMQTRIVENAKLNNVTVEVICAAASDREGTSVIQYSGATPMTSGASLSPEYIHPKKLRTKLVQTMRLDDIPPCEVCAIKIDVERHEMAVLRGARELIINQRPTLIIEILDQKQIGDICDELVDYEPSHILDGRNVLFNPV